MYIRSQILVVLLVGWTVSLVAAAEFKPQGFYSNMEPSVEQGHLYGLEIFILPYVEEESIRYTALVQFADVVPARAQLVELGIDADTVSFSATHPSEGEVHFTGHIGPDGLSGTLGPLGDVTLPRGDSIWQWGPAAP
ncbi:hypothetical protein CKO25_13560 [Thiocapsa imhoffii]|uniref:Uncharacterized protein n=1 Tax=Thiocapsa imhoffii TaxID=382777 RepID=A0A9X0WJJ6_9GAMM|nr:hypothetical protein [Thiocapsa imhoffii]MBK1645655.1 hypothetical protein [Thiocapsa imhoffii]